MLAKLLSTRTKVAAALKMQAGLNTQASNEPSSWLSLDALKNGVASNNP
jgi:hypothetical protein